MEPRERFEELYAAHAGVVRAYARRRMDAAAADDLVAEVFLALWRRLDELPTDPLPWLLGVARRLAANRRRAEIRRGRLAERLSRSEAVASHDSSVLVDLDSEVLRALRSLSTRDQEVLMLVAWDGLDRRHAAAVLGMTPGAFAVRLHRARRRFLRALASRNSIEVEVSR